MAKKSREYVVDCEYVTEGVWVPSRLWVLDGEQAIVRCKNCRHYHDKIESCSLLAPDPWDERNFVSVEPDGFCKWGEIRE